MAETIPETIDDVVPQPLPPPKSRRRVIWGWVIKFALLIAIFIWLFKTDQLTTEGLHELTQRWDLALLAMSMAIPALLICSLRYKLLLRALNIDAHFRDIVSMSMIGMLFDLISPVSNGGDLVKAVYISKATSLPDRKSNFGIVLFSVLLDRIIGLFALFTFGLIVSAVAWPQVSGDEKLRKMAVIGMIVCVVSLLGFFVLVSEKLEGSALRRRLMHAIPFHEKIEGIYAGFAGLRHHKRILAATLGLSILNHICSCTAVLILSQTMTFKSVITGAAAPLEFLPCLTVLPLGLFATVLGPAGGLGVGNAVFENLFRNVLGLKGGGDLILKFQICGILFRLAGVPVMLFYKHKGANLETAPNVVA